MKDYKTVLIVAIIALVTPFLGVPEIYKNWIIGIIAVVLLGYSLRFRSILKKEEGGNKKEIFVESNGESNKDVTGDSSEDDIDEEEPEIQPDVLEEAEEFEDLMEKTDE